MLSVIVSRKYPRSPPYWNVIVFVPAPSTSLVTRPRLSKDHVVPSFMISSASIMIQDSTGSVTSKPPTPKDLTSVGTQICLTTTVKSSPSWFSSTSVRVLRRYEASATVMLLTG